MPQVDNYYVLKHSGKDIDELLDKVNTGNIGILNAIGATANQILAIGTDGKLNWINFSNDLANNFIDEVIWNNIKTQVYG